MSLSSSPTSTTVVPMAGEAPLLVESSRSSKSWPTFAASAKSLRTVNPIRAIVDPIVAGTKDMDRDDGKEFISLALGDPTAAGNLPPCQAILDTIQKTILSPTSAAGYVCACGTPTARQAIADYHSMGELNVTPDQVIIANGCSGALELALTALLDEKTILLVPSPGFPLYKVICESHGAQVLEYRLKGDQWECDFEHLQQLCSKHGNKIRGLLINNPSNPTGAVFSRSHLNDIVEFCREHRLPIVADEIYGELTYGEHVFHPIAPIAAKEQVPVITASGLGKQFLVPGWRVGWLVFSDNMYGSLSQVSAGAKRLAQVILGASHLAQTAVPTALSPETDAWREDIRQQLEHQGNVLYKALSPAPGLHVSRAGGAMYTLMRLDSNAFTDLVSDNQNGSIISKEVAFCQALLREENVFCLPGSCFGMPNVVRVVFCAPPEVLRQAAGRIVAFCERHCQH